VLPIALGLGAGSESRKPLGVVVVGGMLFSTMLTLVLVPVVYSVLARFAVRERHDLDDVLTEEPARSAS
jgi:HAE1 family hydrophobic/amphiphilic exporter-1